MNVAIVGVSGFTGLELVQILLHHSKFRINYVSNSTGGQSLAQIHPELHGVLDIAVSKTSIDDIADKSQLVFLAVPHQTAMSIVPKLLQKGLKVVDLSADYRLDVATYEAAYCAHTDKENLQNATYGLPEFYSKDIANTSLVANPGCYPTATLLGLMPFVSYIKPDTPIFIDAKSGVSGAGKKLNQTTAFMNMQENSFAYSPLTHRHGYEIEYILKNFTKKSYDINFVPHLLPISRGMLCSIYLQLDNKIDATKILTDYYNSQKFVRIRTNPPTIKDTAGTNFCDIFVALKGQNLFINTSIDNLSRGASSQAVVNANIMCGLDEGLGV
ncbi:MAG: N-acetyl-gamma-glutamyl-phosphate reductase [Epsilonproteobacteria bacterium]|nr:MAG: N-acetyl-gamma-glutamyl-phosphate reductase [Campylobacterota bacterium]